MRIHLQAWSLNKFLGSKTNSAGLGGVHIPTLSKLAKYTRLSQTVFTSLDVREIYFQTIDIVYVWLNPV